MRYSDIRVITLCDKGFETDNRDFETVKEARAFAKRARSDSHSWDSSAELEGWHLGNVDEIRLVCDGECLDSWYSDWRVEPPEIVEE